VRTWHDRFRADGIWSEVAALLTRAVRRQRVRPKGFQPLPLRWRIEATFGTLSTRYRRLTRHCEHSPAAAEDGISIANCHRLMQAYQRHNYRNS